MQYIYYMYICDYFKRTNLKDADLLHKFIQLWQCTLGVSRQKDV